MFISAVSLIKDLRNIEFFRKDFRIQRQIEADINYEYIYLVFFVIFLNHQKRCGKEGFILC